MTIWRWIALALLSTTLTLGGLLILGVDFNRIKMWHGIVGMFLIFAGGDLWPSITTIAKFGSVGVKRLSK